MLFSAKGYIKKLIKKGPVFKKMAKRLAQSQFYSKEQLEDFQNNQLQKLIRHCYVNVPFYREMFRELNLTPYDIATKEDLAKLPYLDKGMARENKDRLLARNYPERLCAKVHTSGTTGTPMEIFRDYNSINFENAAIWRLWQNANDRGLKRVTLRGEIVVPASKKEPPFWKYNHAGKELLMSSYHLNQKTVETYIEKFKKFEPEIIYAYPSAVALLAKLFKSNGYKCKLVAVFTSSESVTKEQRELVKEIFGCEIVDWYGQAERVAAIGQCGRGSYHIIEDYSIVEIIDTEGGKEIVGTHLYNYAMPLLRYKTGDFVLLDEDKCSCGSSFRKVSEIIGREANYYNYYTKNGAQILTFDHIPRGVENIIETQIIQEKLDELIIKVSTNSDFNEGDRQKLIRNALEHTYEGMNIIVQQVDSIPRGANGKFKSVIINEELKVV